jgi:hypothetical protein
VFVESFLYEKKNGYFSFLFIYKERIFFPPQISVLVKLNPLFGLNIKKKNLSLKIKKKGKISIFLFVEKDFYEHIIGEIIDLVLTLALSIYNKQQMKQNRKT